MCSTRQTGSIGAACDAGANPSNLLDAIDGLFAYDSGAHDSGISDQKLKHEVVSHLTGLTGGTRRALVARYARRFLTEEGIAAGYGIEDVCSFAQWLAEVGIPLT